MSLITFVQMHGQLSSRPEGDAGATLITLSVWAAAAQAMISGLAIAASAGLCPGCLLQKFDFLTDRHFRLALALKKLALGLKLLVLTLPFPETMHSVYLYWQCETPALCPSSCTQRRGGTCGTIIVDGNGACTCSALERNLEKVVANALLSVAVSLCFTLMRLRKLWKNPEYLGSSIQHPRGKLVAQLVLALVPATIQVLYLIMILEAHQCLTMADVLVIIYPSLVLELMASEVKRALQGWSVEKRSSFSTSFSDDLLLALRPIGVTLASLGGAVSMARASPLSATWPSSSVDCSGTATYWVLISLALFSGAVAAASMGPVASPRTDDLESESLDNAEER